MAITMLKDVEVARVNGKGYGVKVVETNEYKGEKFKTWWTIWFTEPHGLNEGDVITVSGFHSDKIGDPYTDSNGVERRSIERGINSPRLAEGQSKAVPVATAVANDLPF